MTLTHKVALITGAANGIGAAVAKRFAQEGAHVLLLDIKVKDLEKVDDAIQAAGGTATLIPCDLSDHKQLARVAQAIFDRFQRLDILVGNAGLLGKLSPLPHIEPSVWQQVMDVNLHANWHLLRVLDPLLHRAPKGRAMFVTAPFARSATPYWGLVGVSKAGLESLVKIYAAETAHTPLRVNLVEPGPTRTAMLDQAMPGLDKETIPLPEAITDIFVKLAQDDCEETGQIFQTQP